MQDMQETWVQSPGVGNGNPLQYSCLENPMDKGTWQVTVMGSQSQTPLSPYIPNHLDCNNSHTISIWGGTLQRMCLQRSKKARVLFGHNYLKEAPPGCCPCKGQCCYGWWRQMVLADHWLQTSWDSMARLEQGFPHFSMHHSYLIKI